MDKRNGRGGGVAHPGHRKITQKFDIPRGIAQRMIEKLKLEGGTIDEETIYRFWCDPANAQQAKYKHPGRRVLAKEFNISEHYAELLINRFKNG